MTFQNPRPLHRFTRSRPGLWLRGKLDDWKPWVGILLAAVVAVNVWTLTIYRAQAKDEAVHSAEIVANADGQYHQCVTSMPVLAKINRFIVGAQVVDAALVANSRANLAATPKTSPLYELRQGNLERLRDALASAVEVKFPVPTRATCAELRARLLSQR